MGVEGVESKYYEQERRALHKAVQDVVREFENEGVVLKAALVIEISRPDGKRYLAHRHFNIEGERPYSWEIEGPLRDALRAVDLEARSGMITVDEDEDDTK